MTDRETRFYNLFYFFSVCGVTDKHMRVMLLRFACGLKLRDIARLEECHHQNISEKIHSSCRKIKEKINLERFL